MRIDETDYVILKCIVDAGKPLWKNKIHECIRERADALPIKTAASVQTVGRRVDDLAADGFLESAIISPDEIKRDLIIAFKITEKGENAVHERTREYLEQIVTANLFDEEGSEHIGKPAVVELMTDRFGFDRDMKLELLDQYSRDELITMLILYYVKEKVSRVFAEQDADRFLELTGEHSKIFAALQQYMLKNSGG